MDYKDEKDKIKYINIIGNSNNNIKKEKYESLSKEIEKSESKILNEINKA